jgi:hypothetical protein
MRTTTRFTVAVGGTEYVAEIIRIQSGDVGVQWLTFLEGIDYPCDAVAALVAEYRVRGGA